MGKRSLLILLIIAFSVSLFGQDHYVVDSLNNALKKYRDSKTITPGVAYTKADTQEVNLLHAPCSSSSAGPASGWGRGCKCVLGTALLPTASRK